MSRLKDLQQFGQSIWLDSIRRSLITSGELEGLIDRDGLRGVTSNPAIFEKAIAGSCDYVKTIRERAATGARALYEELAIADIQGAADVLRRVYDETAGRDGYVSLEVSPGLAHDLVGTLAEARRLWGAVARENVMIKVPGTPEGILATEELVTEGINVNVTLLFSLEACEQVARAYIAGLIRRAGQGGRLDRVASVASFFVSRIDTAVDDLLQAKIADAGPAQREKLEALLGRAAIAKAKMAYKRYRALFAGPAWRELERVGAQTQRLLWASTGTKNPAYRDVLYIEELIGPDTVNTTPPGTIDLFRDHGRARASLTEGLEEARETLRGLARAGISLETVTRQLLDDGLRQFSEAFEKLISGVERVRIAAISPRVERQRLERPSHLADAMRRESGEWMVARKMPRLWARDATLWTGRDEAQWLGWLDVTSDRLPRLESCRRLAGEVKARGFTDALLLGMGGSSLCPEVMAATFGRQPGFPAFHVLDSTDPAQIRAIERRLSPAHTLFIVASKSGSTLEPGILMRHFLERTRLAVGSKEAGSHFVAVTDPGSRLEEVARQLGFGHVFHGVPSIGGRYSALSNFGLVPAAIMGIDVSRLLDRAEEMVQACGACVPVDNNPGAQLGLLLGLAAREGRDKLTIVTSPRLQNLGAWIEQLVAESTGKAGRAIIPVDLEPLGPSEAYGRDRIFAFVELEGDVDPAREVAVTALARRGHPVVRISLTELADIGQEFFRWEMATAVACSILAINPFDQPDVEASKIETRKLTMEVERSGSLPPEAAIWEGEGVRLFADARNAEALQGSAGTPCSLAGWLKAHLTRLNEGDYFALLAYVEMNESHRDLLQSARLAVRDGRRVASCLGFGPRFLHSTGQAYKGGPNTGVFIQVTCDEGQDLRVPERAWTFGLVKAAQARGDFEVLAGRDRRVLRVHLGQDVAAGLTALRDALGKALA